MVGAAGGQYVLLHMLGRESVVIAECLARRHQRWIVLQAGEVLAGLQQASAQVAFACAPVEPVLGGLTEAEVAAEGFDLLPLAAGHVDVQAMAGRVQLAARQLAEGGQLHGLVGQLREGRGGGQSLGVLLRGFGLIQGAGA